MKNGLYKRRPKFLYSLLVSYLLQRKHVVVFTINGAFIRPTLTVLGGLLETSRKNLGPVYLDQPKLMGHRHLDPNQPSPYSSPYPIKETREGTRVKEQLLGGTTCRDVITPYFNNPACASKIKKIEKKKISLLLRWVFLNKF